MGDGGEGSRNRAAFPPWLPPSPHAQGAVARPLARLEGRDLAALSLATALLDHALLVDEAVDRFALDAASSAVFELVGEANRYVDRTTPWVVGPSQQGRLAILVRALRAIAHELTPFPPQTAAAISARVGECVRHGPPLFPRNG